jgi:hypothetical protein
LIDETKPSQDIFLRGSIIAVIITIPSLTTFFISWTVLDDIITASIFGAVVHFISMGFSFKISKKLFLSKPTKK